MTRPTRAARHRRADQSEGAAAGLLARLGVLPALSAPPPSASAPGLPPVLAADLDGDIGGLDLGGWVPLRPGARESPAEPAAPLPGKLRVRWAVARRAVLGVVLTLLGAVVVALLIVWQAQPSAEAAPRVRRDAPPGPGAVAPTVVTGGASPAGPEVVVHVVGAVRRPGLVRLPAGSRVADALAAAGGVTRSARVASVNLARLLGDGEQLVLTRRGDAPSVAGLGQVGPLAPAAAPAPGSGSPTAPVDLNTATLQVLDSLPGIGPVLAQRILDWRSAHGSFTSVDELGEVSGIGEATLADLRPVVTV